MENTLSDLYFSSKQRKQKAMAQYGISKIRDRQILIAASEFGWIHENGAKDDMWAEIEPCSELDRTSQLLRRIPSKSFTGYWIAGSKVAQCHARHGNGVRAL
jgi:hypothetical protein